MKKIILLILTVAALASFKSTNTRHITGKVFSSDDKQPIIGAAVNIAGTNIGTQTNTKGEFSISVPDGKNRLVFSFVGYQTKKVKIGSTDTLNVYLEPSSMALNEVVVLGYGTTTKRDLTGSVSTVSPVTLQGKAAGVSVGYDKDVLSETRVMRYAPPKVQAPQPSGYNNSLSSNNDESYKAISENAFLAAKDNPLSTFSIDVDAASYSNVRRFINNGQLPPADAVRIEEMINYFKYDLTGPSGDQPVAIHTELSSAPWNSVHRLLRIGLKAKTIPTENLPASNLVFLIDVSGSMDEPNKLPLVKSSLKMLTDQLRAQDRVAIVVYAGNAGLVLPSTPGNDKTAIKDAIDNLSAGGSTAGGEGLKLAYKIAKENFKTGGNNRIVMATDGDFNVGPSSDGDMEHLIEKERDTKVDLSIMGFGMGNYKDSKMETLADKGNGNYAYIDNITEARKAFVTEFGGTLFTVAKDVKVQVEFNPAKVQAYRLLGYEDRMLAKEDFNNDKKDAGDMGSGHTVTAFYEIIPAGVKDNFSSSVDPLKYQKTKDAPAGNNYSDELMTIKFRYKQPGSDSSKMSLATVADKPADFKSTSDDFRFAAAVAEFGMLLRGSEYKQKSSFDQAISIAKGAKGKDDDGYRSEFVRIAESARSLASNTDLITKE
jgi:Ca-activated chloride channel family protein